MTPRFTRETSDERILLKIEGFYLPPTFYPLLFFLSLSLSLSLAELYD